MTADYVNDIKGRRQFVYTRTEIEKMAADFEDCRKVLVALGDENICFIM